MKFHNFDKVSEGLSNSGLPIGMLSRIPSESIDKALQNDDILSSSEALHGILKNPNLNRQHFDTLINHHETVSKNAPRVYQIPRATNFSNWTDKFRLHARATLQLGSGLIGNKFANRDDITRILDNTKTIHYDNIGASHEVQNFVESALKNPNFKSHHIDMIMSPVAKMKDDLSNAQDINNHIGRQTEFMNYLPANKLNSTHFVNILGQSVQRPQPKHSMVMRNGRHIPEEEIDNPVEGLWHSGHDGPESPPDDEAKRQKVINTKESVRAIGRLPALKQVAMIKLLDSGMQSKKHIDALYGSDHPDDISDAVQSHLVTYHNHEEKMSPHHMTIINHFTPKESDGITALTHRTQGLSSIVMHGKENDSNGYSQNMIQAYGKDAKNVMGSILTAVDQHSALLQKHLPMLEKTEVNTPDENGSLEAAMLHSAHSQIGGYISNALAKSYGAKRINDAQNDPLSHEQAGRIIDYSKSILNNPKLAHMHWGAAKNLENIYTNHIHHDERTDDVNGMYLRPRSSTESGDQMPFAVHFHEMKRRIPGNPPTWHSLNSWKVYFPSEYDHDSSIGDVPAAGSQQNISKMLDIPPNPSYGGSINSTMNNLHVRITADRNLSYENAKKLYDMKSSSAGGNIIPSEIFSNHHSYHEIPNTEENNNPINFVNNKLHNWDNEITVADMANLSKFRVPYYHNFDVDKETGEPIPLPRPRQMKLDI